MDNINQLKLVDLKLNDAIQKIIDVNSDAIFVVEGDVFCGTLKLIQGIDEDNFIYVTDTMDIGEVHSSILSEEFIALRVKTLSNLSGVPYDIEYKRYEQFVSKLRKMARRSGVNIYFIQSNYYISQIWQLTMQAYIKQIGIGKHIKRLCVDESLDCISNFDDIAISGSYNAYCKLMCCRIPIDLEKYLIETEAVKCYLDINSNNIILKDYIRKMSLHFKNKYQAFVQFNKDFPNWGLSDTTFFKILNDIGVEGREQFEI